MTLLPKRLINVSSPSTSSPELPSGISSEFLSQSSTRFFPSFIMGSLLDLVGV
jgi:hypothetical protein